MRRLTRALGDDAYDAGSCAAHPAAGGTLHVQDASSVEHLPSGACGVHRSRTPACTRSAALVSSFLCGPPTTMASGSLAASSSSSLARGGRRPAVGSAEVVPAHAALAVGARAGLLRMRRPRRGVLATAMLSEAQKVGDGPKFECSDAPDDFLIMYSGTYKTIEQASKANAGMLSPAGYKRLAGALFGALIGLLFSMIPKMLRSLSGPPPGQKAPEAEPPESSRSARSDADSR
eukprot:TRINITY_DN68731_c0_g1_i1.p1 TRINITY_DN68731_c0_g1~~TRINITY_DN68731_c0_g1_i1.p1  ORF type:complete len:247 (+),score=44.22 TRINITY_DN68731_c0_g1_i1:43-741(+)